MYMNITRERVRQIEHSALAKLKDNSGGDITWIGKLTLPVPDCRRCGEAYVRVVGRQAMCPNCEATRKRKRLTPAQMALMQAHAAVAC